MSLSSLNEKAYPGMTSDGLSCAAGRPSPRIRRCTLLSA